MSWPLHAVCLSVTRCRRPPPQFEPRPTIRLAEADPEGMESERRENPGNPLPFFHQRTDLPVQVVEEQHRVQEVGGAADLQVEVDVEAPL